MSSYRRVGDVPPKRHTQHRDSTGRLYAEELMGEEGFSFDSSLLYHRGIPSAMTAARPSPQENDGVTSNEPLLPRHFRLHDLSGGWEGRDAVSGRQLILGNADVRIRYAVAGAVSPYYRNAIGDECVFVEAGTAAVETVFGQLDATPG